MKVTSHIPTEQYGFVEIEHDDCNAERVAEEYALYSKAFQSKPENTLPKKEWNDALDRYRLGNGMEVDIMERMNEVQKWVIHELDKSDSRIKGRESKPVVDGQELQTE